MSHRRDDPPLPRPRLGLCSVTLRALAPADVVAAAVAARLESIEWGSDIHVRAGDLENARRVGDETREAGLVVCSYGSYVQFPWAREVPEDFGDVLRTAQALGAPRIRVWAGPTASAEAEADAESRRSTVDELTAMAARADAVGIDIALEFHLGTLADTAESTVRLLDEIDAPNVSTYWQPAIGATDDQAMSDLDALSPSVSTMHVFSWDASFGRHPLASRSEMWSHATDRATGLPRVTDLLLEFLPSDDVELLASEAAFLRTLRDRSLLAVTS